MRNLGWSAIGLVVVALAAGCPSKDDASASARKQLDTAAEHVDTATSEAKQGARALKDYSYAEKDQFVARMRKDLAELEAELTRLSAKIDRVSGAAKAEAQHKLGVVREKWAETKDQLDQAEMATESTWESVKSRFSDSYDGLRVSFEDSRQWLSDKIEP